MRPSLPRPICRICKNQFSNERWFCPICGRDRYFGIKLWELVALSGALVAASVLVMGFYSLLTPMINRYALSRYALSNPTPSQSTTTPTIVSYETEIFATETLVPTHFPTSTAIPPTALPKNLKDGVYLMFIPSGSFTMGSSPEDDPYFWGAEGPPHVVNLEDFYIYQTEVTNGMYENCVKEKACPLPQVMRSRTRRNYYGNPEFSSYPVIYISWVHALSYCQWAGGRLPTEAEWEKAARGADGRLFPWGNSIADNLANICEGSCANDTYPVGQFNRGASPYGVFDMSGNVWEWVED